MANYFYEDVFRRAIDDLESFYKKEYAFSINVSYSDNLRQHASIIGAKDKSKIRFSGDCCNKKIDDSKDFFVALLIVCHELAHYLNHHNYFLSNDDEDNRIIEAWADNFGSKIFMVLITFGEKTRDLCRVFQVPKHSGDRIYLIGGAFKQLCSMFYRNESTKYHYRMERMMHICAGISSFLQFYWGKLDLQLTVDIYVRLYQSSGMYDIVETDHVYFPLSNDNFDKVIDIHYPLQNNQPAITLGLKKEYRKYIDTSFFKNVSMANDYRRIFYQTAIAQADKCDCPSNLKEFFEEKLKELS
ncbi:hypothetical protein [Pantoea anthophila]|uniref:ImmA/IrrE family metallo-endopeptidase n=1 Tax=Pantoea anthophila TaxID=470931 RepID=UPI003018562C